MDAASLNIEYTKAFLEFTDEDQKSLFVRELTSTADSTVIKNKITAGIHDIVGQTALARLKFRKVTLNQHLTDIEKKKLSSAFVNFSLDFKQTAIEIHAFAHAHRILEYYDCLNAVNYFSSGIRDSVIKDIGGNIQLIVYRGLKNVHCCLPLLSNNDHNRFSSAYVSFQNHTAAMNYQKSLLKDFFSPNPTIFCHKKSQQCTVQAQNGIAIHSVYDMTLTDIADAMSVSGMNMLVGTFFFNYEMLIQDSGRIPYHNVRWFIRYRPMKQIVFVFDGDYQEPYVHDYSVFLEKVTTIFFFDTERKNSYHLKILKTLNDVVFFQIVRNITGYSKEERVTRCISIPKDQDINIIKYFVPTFSGASKFHHLRPKYLKVSRFFLNTLLEHLCVLPQNEFTYQKTLEYATSANNRTIVNGVSVSLRQKMDFDELSLIAFACYMYTYELKYDLVKTLNIVKNRIESTRATGVFSSLFCKLKTSVGDAVDVFLESFSLYFSKFFGSLVLPSSSLVQVFNYSPVILETNQLIPDTISPYYSLGYAPLFLSQSREELPEEDEPLEIPYTLWAKCDFEGDLVDVPGDGNCFFHCLVLAGVVPTVLKAKEELKKLISKKGFDPKIYEDQIKITELDCVNRDYWANEQTIALMAHILNIRICCHIHDPYRCERYGAGELIHIQLKNEHFQYLKPVTRVISKYFVSYPLTFRNDEYDFDRFEFEYADVDDDFVNSSDYDTWNVKYSTYYANRTYLNRSAAKFADILLYYRMNVEGIDCLDVGSGPGGFLSILLEKKVNSIDFMTLPDYPVELDDTRLNNVGLNVPDKMYDFISYDVAGKCDSLQDFDTNIDLYNHYFPMLFDHLNMGGMAIIKFYYLQNFDQKLFLDLIAGHFEKVYFTRSSFSSLFNNEWYLVCVNKRPFEQVVVSSELVGKVNDQTIVHKKNLLTGEFSFDFDFEAVLAAVGTGRWYYSIEGGYSYFTVRGSVTDLYKQVWVDADYNEFKNLIENGCVIRSEKKPLLEKFTPKLKNSACLIMSKFLFSLKVLSILKKIDLSVLLPMFRRLVNFDINISQTPCCNSDMPSSTNCAYYCCEAVVFVYPCGYIFLKASVAEVVTILSDHGYRLLRPSKPIEIKEKPIEICMDLVDSAKKIPDAELKSIEPVDELDPPHTYETVISQPDVDFIETHYSDFTLKSAVAELYDVWERSLVAFNSDLELSATFLRSTLPNQPSQITPFCDSKDDQFVVLDRRSGKLVYYPYEPPDFDPMYVYDIKTQLLVKYDPKNLPEFCFTNKDLTIYLEPDMLARFKSCRSEVQKYQSPAKINFMTGPPGCGKTTRICKMREPGDLIVCATRAGVSDYLHKLSLDKSYDVRTIYSYLLNSDKKYDTVYFDEALMVHPGYLQLLLYKTGAKYLHIFGDYRQIPYYCRIPYRLKFSNLDKIIKPTEFIPVSYRCPGDVCRWLQSFYLPDKFESKNYNLSSIKIDRFPGHFSDIIIRDDAVLLCYLQSEKTQLIKCFPSYPVFTIHEFQGKESRVVHLFRLEFKNYTVYDSEPHWIVALSRHTQSFCYHIPANAKDKLADSLKRISGGYKLEFDTLPSYLLDVDTTDKPISSSGSDLFFFKENFSDAYKHLLKGACITLNRSLIYSSNRRIILLGSISDLVDIIDLLKLRQIHTLDYNFRSDFPRVLSIFSKYRVKIIIHSRKLAVVSADSVSRVMFKHLIQPTADFVYKPDDIFYKTIYPPVIVPPSITLVKSSDVVSFSPAIVDYTGHVTFRNLPVTTAIFKSTFLTESTRKKFIKNLNRKMTVTDYTLNLQKFVDSYFSGIRCFDNTYDVYAVQHTDKVYYIESCKFVTTSVNTPYMIPDNVVPKLVTGIGYDRPYNTNEVLLALSKRNMAVPKTDTLFLVHNDAKRTVTNMLKAFTTGPNFYPPLTTTIGAVYYWMSGQPSSIQKQFTNLSIFQLPLNEYSLTIKKNPKPLLELSVFSTYQALQTIVFSSKDANSFFCPIFKLVMDRLKAFLRPNVIIFSDFSPEEFTNYMNDMGLSADEYVYSVEVDLGKYDKSQHIFHLMVDCVFLSTLGVPDYVVILWWNMHYYTQARDRYTKTIFTSFFQRKSGDPSTYALNTVDNMCNVMDMLVDQYSNIDRLISSLDSNDLILLFSGDDLLVLSRHMIPIFMDLISKKYNFEAKKLNYKYSLFCSRFFLRMDGLFYIIPDIFKMVVKLGRRDLKCRQHVDDYRISFRDNLKAFICPQKIFDTYSDALSERYPGICFDRNLVNMLFELTSNLDIFEKIYKPNNNYHLNYGALKDL